MKRLSLLVALSALVCSVSSASAQSLSGSINLQDTGPGTHFSYMPSGANEIGRFGRFMVDHRLTDMTFENRDFVNWKPATGYSKSYVSRRIRGTGQDHHPDARRVATRIYIPVMYY